MLTCFLSKLQFEIKLKRPNCVNITPDKQNLSFEKQSPISTQCIVQLSAVQDVLMQNDIVHQLSPSKASWRVTIQDVILKRDGFLTLESPLIYRIHSFIFIQRQDRAGQDMAGWGQENLISSDLVPLMFWYNAPEFQHCLFVQLVSILFFGLIFTLQKKILQVLMNF